MSNQTSNQTAPGDTSGGPVITGSDGKSYLNREAFDFKKHTKINNGLFWRAFNLGIFLILSIFDACSSKWTVGITLFLIS